MQLEEFINKNKSKMNEIEQQFVEDIFYTYAGENGLDFLQVQTPFEDYQNKKRKLDFTIKTNRYKYVIEIDGYTYHAEGAQRVSPEYFDDLLDKQNDLVINEWTIIRFSYNQIRNHPEKCIDTLRRTFKKDFQLNPYFLHQDSFSPTYPQQTALDNMEFYRNNGNNKGVVLMPTGMGKTVLAALDAKRINGKTLFVVHRNDILQEAFHKFNEIWPESTKGFFNADEKNTTAQVIFASKDTLYREGNITLFSKNHFELIIIDEVHHSACTTYKNILDYFNPKYMVGLTATPERQDRLDILQLFDYNIYYELKQIDAIQAGYLSGFIYYGLKDDIDYSKIKHNGIRYDVADLGRKLDIPERNKAILDKYNLIAPEKKALGFCVTIDHAISMAEFFNKNGIPAKAIHSDTTRLSSEERKAYIQDFRDSKLQILFTVDVFNEGVDFPDIEALLFLRPTESKTIFIQQLGRGLRLNPNKNHVIVLDFIGNFKNADRVKDFLGGKSNGNLGGGKSNSNRFPVKGDLEWPLGCEVNFEESVEELFKKLDQDNSQITKQDLIDNYYIVKEALKKKPTSSDIDNHELSQYKSSNYAKLFGSWNNFIKEIGEATKASYHYPQGTHLGHIFYIINTIKNKKFNNLISPEVYAPEGNVTEIGRQTRYKVWACMELGLLFDDRNPDNINDSETFTHLTPSGEKLYSILEKNVSDPTFYDFNNSKSLTWSMAHHERYFNDFIKSLPDSQKSDLEDIFFKMDAVQQMLKFLFHENKNIKSFTRTDIYSNFFSCPFVKEYLEINGISQSSSEGAKRRIPFILNILEAFGVIRFVDKSTLELIRLPYIPVLFDSQACMDATIDYYTNSTIPNKEILTELKTLFGTNFMTPRYFLTKN